jgi:hypothetical protein
VTEAAARTRMAWRRTVLAATVVTVLAMRATFVDTVLVVVDAVLVVAAAAGWLALLVIAWRPARRAVPMAALIVAGYAALGIVIALRTA